MILLNKNFRFCTSVVQNGCALDPHNMGLLSSVRTNAPLGSVPLELPAGGRDLCPFA